jgi:hypothetical protein
VPAARDADDRDRPGEGAPAREAAAVRFGRDGDDVLEAIGEGGADREDAPGQEPVVIGQKYAYGHASIVSV